MYYLRTTTKIIHIIYARQHIPSQKYNTTQTQLSQDLHHIVKKINIMHENSYHAHIRNKQTNSTMSFIRNTYVLTCISTSSQNFLRSYLCNFQMSSLLPPILSNPFKSFYLGSLSITFHCSFYFRETIALIDIDHVMLNMDPGVIEPHTEKRWSTSQSRTECDIAFLVDPLASIL